MEPTLGVSITDVGGTSFDKMDVGGASIGAPDIRLPSVNTGFSIKPYQTESRYWLLAVDAHSINQPYSFSKKLNLGTEFFPSGACLKSNLVCIKAISVADFSLTFAC